MSEIQRFREQNDAVDDGTKFTKWLSGTLTEDYAHKVSAYCESMKNCEDCQFYNGTCRLNGRPYSWDMKSL